MADNVTELFEHLVVTNKFLENRLYHYIVHLSTILMLLSDARDVSLALLVLYSIFQSILPFVLLSYFNLELIRSINASTNFLKHFTSLSGQHSRNGGDKNMSRCREGSVTRSVVCLIVLFTLCQVPASILHYIYMFYRNNPVLYVCYDISNFLILVNSAVSRHSSPSEPSLCLSSTIQGELLHFHVLQSKVSP